VGIAADVGVAVGAEQFLLAVDGIVENFLVYI
jgi:hypothetical protein